MVTTRSQAAADATQHEPEKTSPSSKSHSKEQSSQALPAAKKRRTNEKKSGSNIGRALNSVGPQAAKFREAEAQRQWTNQYFQGKSISELSSGIGCGFCTLSLSQVEFVSPFTGEGSLETMTGETSANGPGDGSIRLVKGPDYDPVYSGRGLPDTFLVPLHNIEQIIVTPSTSPKSDGMLQVVIVPTGATVASAALKDRPEIIHFKWPDRDADESLGGQVATPMVKDGKATYLSVLQAALDQLLAPYDKKVIVYSDEAQAADPSLKFKCSATRTSTLDVNEKAEGSFFFLSTGILWLSQTILYLPFSSLEAVHTIFMRDVASKTPEDGAPIVAMAVLISVSEQFRESQQDQTTANILNFEDVEDFTSMGSSIKKYCEAHGVGFVKLQQTYYNYAAGEMMTGYSPWTNETGG